MWLVRNYSLPLHLFLSLTFFSSSISISEVFFYSNIFLSNLLSFSFISYFSKNLLFQIFFSYFLSLFVTTVFRMKWSWKCVILKEKNSGSTFLASREREKEIEEKREREELFFWKKVIHALIQFIFFFSFDLLIHFHSHLEEKDSLKKRLTFSLFLLLSQFFSLSLPFPWLSLILFYSSPSVKFKGPYSSFFLLFFLHTQSSFSFFFLSPFSFLFFLSFSYSNSSFFPSSFDSWYTVKARYN